MTDETPEATTETVGHLWLRIEAALRERNPPRLQGLAPGASDEAIAAVEAATGLSLPGDFHASCRIHDGGIRLEPVLYMRLLSLADVVDWWQTLEELRHDESWVTQPPYYFQDDVIRELQHPGPLRPIWWDAHWVPVAQDYAGNLACLDLAPEPGGTVGQVIDWDHECGPSALLYPSFTALLTALADQFDRGNVYLEDN